MENVELICAAVVGWLAASVGWFQWWHEVHEKRKEQTAKEKVEAELVAAQNRADGPFFSVSPARVNALVCGDSEVWHVSNENVLSSLRDEVPPNMPAGTLVILPIANDTENLRAATFHMRGKKIRSIQYIDGDSSLWGILEYPFDPNSFGSSETVEVMFESRNGIHRVHRYATEHGRRTLVRIDPPLPGNAPLIQSS